MEELLYSKKTARKKEPYTFSETESCNIPKKDDVYFLLYDHLNWKEIHSAFDYLTSKDEVWQKAGGGVLKFQPNPHFNPISLTYTERPNWVLAFVQFKTALFEKSKFEFEFKFTEIAKDQTLFSVTCFYDNKEDLTETWGKAPKDLLKEMMAGIQNKLRQKKQEKTSVIEETTLPLYRNR